MLLASQKKQERSSWNKREISLFLNEAEKKRGREGRQVKGNGMGGKGREGNRREARQRKEKGGEGRGRERKEGREKVIGEGQIILGFRIKSIGLSLSLVRRHQSLLNHHVCLGDMFRTFHYLNHSPNE